MTTALTEHSVIDAELRHVFEIASLEKETFSEPWSEKSLTDTLTGNNSLFLVCEKSGEVAGYVGCYVVCDEAAITNVAVSSKFRRLGIADALITALKGRAKEKGCSVITLEVRVSNSPAILLYEKHGFKTVGTRRGFYTNPREDAYVMLYELV